ncbi:hypothetical protein [Sphingomonas sp. R86521]|uniref:hypothetical protein n=1 Tax=Sphingomonas sp. R86521 TaxID=3093860 RepID=UPI0036D233E6
MKSYAIGALVAAIGIACAAPAAAQIGVEANGARADGHWGGEIGVGYSVGLAGFKITPSAGALVYSGSNDRYETQDNGGSSRCRDLSNGQYADKARCDNTKVKAYGRVEATYSIPLFATVGAGVRVGRDTRPYGIVALPLAPLLKLKGNAGPHYFAAGLTLGY